LFSYVSQLHGGPKIETDEDIQDLYEKRKDLWIMAYDKLRLLPQVYSLANDPIIMQTLEDFLIKRPILSAKIVVRADMPFDESYDFMPHQDYPFNLGSLNSVTVWIPFQDTSEEDGALKISQNPDLQFTIYNHEVGILKNKNFASNLKSIPMKAGQILCFSQFAIHSSGKNIGKKIRFSIQLRYSDLEDSFFIKHKWVLNNKDTPVPFGEIDSSIISNN
jgi:ectoine hydroxylase-related dioxygenase (phytanoyl-CoA dioxygenase family)